jgi:hypothetical protein
MVHYCMIIVKTPLFIIFRIINQKYYVEFRSIESYSYKHLKYAD